MTGVSRWPLVGLNDYKIALEQGDAVTLSQNQTTRVVEVHRSGQVVGRLPAAVGALFHFFNVPGVIVDTTPGRVKVAASLYPYRVQS